MSEDREKVLIIKPGFSETLDPEISGFVSLGDIVRTTLILHLFPQRRYHVTWLVDSLGMPLLRNHPMINRVLKINAFTPYHLMNEHFDIVVNLEKDPGICAMADAIPAWRRYGFRFDAKKGIVSSYEHSHEALRMVEDPEIKRSQSRSWADVLYEMLGARYEGQPYVLGYTPSGDEPKYDVGLNYRAGRKFPLKIWPDTHWEGLEKQLGNDLSVSRQPENDDIENIESYFDWISQCRVIVTNDSLGMHIAMALGRSVVSFFGPTQAHEIHDVENVIKLTPNDQKTCLGCTGTVCERGTPCIHSISVDSAEDAVRTLLEKEDA